MCDVTYDEWAWTCLEWKLVRARKDYACEACFSGIKKGELHRVVRGIYDEHFSGGRRCLRCDTIAEAMEARGCRVDFDLGELAGERVEDSWPHVEYSEPICELPFLTQEELEQRAQEKPDV